MIFKGGGEMVFGENKHAVCPPLEFNLRWPTLSSWSMYSWHKPTSWVRIHKPEPHHHLLPLLPQD